MQAAISRPTCTVLRTTSASFLFQRQIHDIKKVGIIGMGLMGHGIAQATAQAGFEVIALDVQQKFVDSGMNSIKNSLGKISARNVKKGLATAEDGEKNVAEIMKRISGTTEVKGLTDCDLVIEAVKEDMDLKRTLYAELGRSVKSSGILASNTSSLSITQIGEASGRPENMIGLHFFNPVQMMKLVEVIKTDKTNDDVVIAAMDYVKKIKKTPVSCKDTPGFIVNRLLVPYLASAIAMADRGDASLADVDVSMQLGAGHPMGPITLADYVGLDTCLSILQGWCEQFPDEPAFFVPESLKQKVAEGKFGRKSGEGYFKWEGDKRV